MPRSTAGFATSPGRPSLALLDRLRRAGAAPALPRKAEDRYRTRNALLWAAGGVWALNVVDAYVFGVDGDKLVAAPVPVDGGAGLVLAARF